MNRYLLRITSVVVVPALLVDPATALALSDAEGLAFAEKATVPGASGTVPPPITIPARWGRITDAYGVSPESCVLSRESNTATLARDAGLKTQDPRLVVLIQDLHGHPGVQRNIANILKHLSRHGSCVMRGASRSVDSRHTTHDSRHRVGSRHLTVFVEGASGPFDVSLLRNVPNPWVKKKAVEHFLNELKLTGAEVAAIESKTPMHLWGVDDKDLYLQNLEAFYKASTPSPLSSPPVGRGSSKSSPLPWGERVGVRGTSRSPSPSSSLLKGEEDDQKAWSPVPHPKHPAWQEYYAIAKERDIPLALNTLAHLDLLTKGYRQTMSRPPSPSPVHPLRGLPMLKRICSWAGPLPSEGEGGAGHAVDGGGEGVVALVAGGYHTEGISRLLRANHIGYAVVTPTVPGLGYEHLYTRRLQDLALQARQEALAALLIFACRHWLPAEAQATLGAIAAFLLLRHVRSEQDLSNSLRQTNPESTEKNSSRHRADQPPAIALVIQNGVWEPYVLSLPEHNVINMVWRGFRSEYALPEKDDIRQDIARALQQRLGDEFEKYALHIESPTQNLFEQRLRVVADSSRVTFPATFRLITHPGTGRRRPGDPVRSWNLLIPQDELDRLRKMRQTDRDAYNQWLNHEVEHLADRAQTSPDAAEPDIVTRAPIDLFLTRYTAMTLPEPTIADVLPAVREVCRIDPWAGAALGFMKTQRGQVTLKEDQLLRGIQRLAGFLREYNPSMPYADAARFLWVFLRHEPRFLPEIRALMEQGRLNYDRKQSMRRLLESKPWAHSGSIHDYADFLLGFMEEARTLHGLGDPEPGLSNYLSDTHFEVCARLIKEGEKRLMVDDARTSGKVAALAFHELLIHPDPDQNHRMVYEYLFSPETRTQQEVAEKFSRSTDTFGTILRWTMLMLRRRALERHWRADDLTRLALRKLSREDEEDPKQSETRALTLHDIARLAAQSLPGVEPADVAFYARAVAAGPKPEGALVRVREPGESEERNRPALHLADLLGSARVERFRGGYLHVLVNGQLATLADLGRPFHEGDRVQILRGVSGGMDADETSPSHPRFFEYEIVTLETPDQLTEFAIGTHRFRFPTSAVGRYGVERADVRMEEQRGDAWPEVTDLPYKRYVFSLFNTLRGRVTQPPAGRTLLMGFSLRIRYGPQEITIVDSDGKRFSLQRDRIQDNLEDPLEPEKLRDYYRQVILFAFLPAMLECLPEERNSILAVYQREDLPEVARFLSNFGRTRIDLDVATLNRLDQHFAQKDAVQFLETLTQQDDPELWRIAFERLAEPLMDLQNPNYLDRVDFLSQLIQQCNGETLQDVLEAIGKLPRSLIQAVGWATAYMPTTVRERIRQALSQRPGARYSQHWLDALDQLNIGVASGQIQQSREEMLRGPYWSVSRYHTPLANAHGEFVNVIAQMPFFTQEPALHHVFQEQVHWYGIHLLTLLYLNQEAWGGVRVSRIVADLCAPHLQRAIQAQQQGRSLNVEERRAALEEAAQRLRLTANNLRTHFANARPPMDWLDHQWALNLNFTERYLSFLELLLKYHDLLESLTPTARHNLLRNHLPEWFRLSEAWARSSKQPRPGAFWQSVNQFISTQEHILSRAQRRQIHALATDVLHSAQHLEGAAPRAFLDMVLSAPLQIAGWLLAPFRMIASYFPATRRTDRTPPSAASQDGSDSENGDSESAASWFSVTLALAGALLLALASPVLATQTGIALDPLAIQPWFQIASALAAVILGLLIHEGGHWLEVRLEGEKPKWEVHRPRTWREFFTRGVSIKNASGRSGLLASVLGIALSVSALRYGGYVPWALPFAAASLAAHLAFLASSPDWASLRVTRQTPHRRRSFNLLVAA